MSAKLKVLLDDSCADEGGSVPLVLGGEGREEGELIGDAVMLGVAIGCLLGAGLIGALWAVVS